MNIILYYLDKLTNWLDFSWLITRGKRAYADDKNNDKNNDNNNDNNDASLRKKINYDSRYDSCYDEPLLRV
jgi:hypothetical protein